MTTRFALTMIAALAAARAFAASPADVNGDGRIDAADLQRMRAEFFGHDAQADLNRDGRVDFADLVLLKAAFAGVDASGRAERSVETPPPPSVYLLPETQSVAVGDPVNVDLYWDFTGEAALGGGTDIMWDPNALSFVTLVFDDNFGTGNGQFDPALTRCDGSGLEGFCNSPGLIDGLATGNFNGLGDPGPIYIATITFTALAAGEYTVSLAEDVGGPAGVFVSAITFRPYDDLTFAGGSISISSEPGPRISVSPSLVTFPDTVIGDTSSAPVTVTSAGELPLTISGVTPPDAPFGVSVDECSGQTLDPGDSCGITVTFTPPETGPASDSFSIASNDPNRPTVDVPLEGTGIPVQEPDLVTLTLVHFGGVRLGQAETFSLDVSNAGAATLVIGEIGVTNPLEPPFSIIDDGCSGISLPPGGVESCLVTLRFAPTALGGASDSLDIPSNDPDSPITTVDVQGTPAPHLYLEAAQLSGVRGRCRNLDTGQVWKGMLDGSSQVPCEDNGVILTPGDTLSITIEGTSLSSSAVPAEAFGMEVHRIRCTNETTGQQVRINPPGLQPRWDCVASGLVVNVGDLVSMTAAGGAL